MNRIITWGAYHPPIKSTVHAQDAFEQEPEMTTNNEARERAFEEVERVAKLNATGFVARTYDSAHDEFVWSYGSLKLYDKALLEYIRQHFKLGKNDDHIGWVQLKEFLREFER